MSEEQPVNLTPDMSAVWGRVLRALRESGEAVIYAAAAELNDIEFTSENIKIYCKNEPLYSLLLKYLAHLNKHAGGDIIKIYKPKKAADTKKTDELKKIFGDKLTVKQ